jgi:LPS O-antigen subunit length determinant protein (WzzB/FepE family)
MKAQAYCVKCKAEKPMADAKETTLKNGRHALKGKCSDCDTGMFKILPSPSKPAKRTAPKTPTATAPTETDPSSGLLGGGWTLLG